MKQKIKIMIKADDSGKTLSGLEVWGACKKRDLQECFERVKECFTPAPPLRKGILKAKIYNDDIIVEEI